MASALRAAGNIRLGGKLMLRIFSLVSCDLYVVEVRLQRFLALPRSRTRRRG